MVSDEFKKMIKKETSRKIEARAVRYRAKMKAYEKIMKSLKNYESKEEQDLFENAEARYCDYKDKLFFCKRILALKRTQEKEEQVDSVLERQM